MGFHCGSPVLVCVLAKSSGVPAGFFVSEYQNNAQILRCFNDGLLFTDCQTIKNFGALPASAGFSARFLSRDFFRSGMQKKNPILSDGVLQLHHGHLPGEVERKRARYQHSHRHSSTDVRNRQALRQNFLPGVKVALSCPSWIAWARRCARRA